MTCPREPLPPIPDNSLPPIRDIPLPPPLPAAASGLVIAVSDAKDKAMANVFFFVPLISQVRVKPSDKTSLRCGMAASPESRVYAGFHGIEAISQQNRHLGVAVLPRWADTV